MDYKINKYINSTLKNSYAKESKVEKYQINIDCYEGINNITFSNEVINFFQNIDYTSIKEYPQGTSIKDGIIKYWNKNNDLNLDSANIILCDGSINGIYTINRLFLNPKDKVLGYVPQFPEYGLDVRMHGCDFEYYKLKKENNYKFIVEEFIECINEKYKLIYLDNPNNPTGQIIPLKSIEKILLKAKSLGIMVIIDEAYGEYMHKDNSAINLMNKFENLIVLKTFSKGFALAGLRAGYMVLSKKLNVFFSKITNPYSINEIARRVSCLVLEDDNFISETLKRNKEIKNNFMINWKKLYISKTSDYVSIFLIEHKDKDINLKEEFAKLGIGVVCGSSFESLDRNCVRFRIPNYKDLDEVKKAFEYIDSL